MVISLLADGWAPLREFFVSDSGYVQPREGLGLGWVAGTLAVLAAIFHPQAAEADYYENCPFPLAPGQCAWLCPPDIPARDCTPPQDKLLSERWCRNANGTQCTLVATQCTCE